MPKTFTERALSAISADDTRRGHVAALLDHTGARVHPDVRTHPDPEAAAAAVAATTPARDAADLVRQLCDGEVLRRVAARDTRKDVRAAVAGNRHTDVGVVVEIAAGFTDDEVRSLLGAASPEAVVALVVDDPRRVDLIPGTRRGDLARSGPAEVAWRLLASHGLRRTPRVWREASERLRNRGQLRDASYDALAAAATASRPPHSRQEGAAYAPARWLRVWVFEHAVRDPDAAAHLWERAAADPSAQWRDGLALAGLLHRVWPDYADDPAAALPELVDDPTRVAGLLRRQTWADYVVVDRGVAEVIARYGVAEGEYFSTSSRGFCFVDDAARDVVVRAAADAGDDVLLLDVLQRSGVTWETIRGLAGQAPLATLLHASPPDCWPELVDAAGGLDAAAAAVAAAGANRRAPTRKLPSAARRALAGEAARRGVSQGLHKEIPVEDWPADVVAADVVAADGALRDQNLAARALRHVPGIPADAVARLVVDSELTGTTRAPLPALMSPGAANRLDDEVLDAVDAADAGDGRSRLATMLRGFDGHVDAHVDRVAGRLVADTPASATRNTAATLAMRWLADQLTPEAFVAAVALADSWHGTWRELAATVDDM